MNEKRRALLALALLVPVPSLGTLMGMVVAEGTVGQIVYGTSKVYIWLFPVAWLVLVEKRRPVFPLPSKRGMLAACSTGGAIVVVIAAAYWLLGGWIADDLEAMNSLLEEYVWRWFVATHCELLMRRWLAVTTAGLLFTLHHIIALDVYFGWRIVVLGSVGVFIGGTTWSWLYLRYRNIWAAYVSHVFADVIIFAIGWKLLFM
ncbi:MAG: lysostaphin resistance A-like protein [Planctomycetota bacterium]